MGGNRAARPSNHSVQRRRRDEPIRFRRGNRETTTGGKALRYKTAKTELEAKFCIPFLLSSIAIRRKAGIREFTDEEAHKQKLRTIAHIFYLVDAKDLMRAGVDGFAHGVRDRDIDDEFMTLLKQRRVFFTPNLPDRPLTAADLPLVIETLPPVQAQRVRDEVANRGRSGGLAGAPQAAAAVTQGRGGVPTGDALFFIQARNLKRISDAGVSDIGLGTDSGDKIGWPALTEMADMVTAGMTPAQVIVAATRTTANILKLDQLGTIAPGKAAYFLVLDANPLDDIRNTRRIANVYLNGKEVNRAGLRSAFTSAR